MASLVQNRFPFPGNQAVRGAHSFVAKVEQYSSRHHTLVAVFQQSWICESACAVLMERSTGTENACVFTVTPHAAKTKL
jgi:hypothetical protein